MYSLFGLGTTAACLTAPLRTMIQIHTPAPPVKPQIPVRRVLIQVTQFLTTDATSGYALHHSRSWTHPPITY